MTSLVDEKVFNSLLYEKGRQAVPPDFPGLPEIPGGRYTRQDFLDLEMEHVFRKSWLLAGLEEQVPKPGSYKRFNKLGSPILIVRGRDHRLRAFYNTCRHRGAPVVRDETGRCNILRCQYHSWAYDFEGQLVQVPDERDFHGLDKAARGLIPVRCETYRGLIFINEDPDAAPLLSHLGPLAEEWKHTLLDGSRLDYYSSVTLSCNWKCASDAFQEVYHVNTLHPDTVGAALDHFAASMELLPGGNSRMSVRLARHDIDARPADGWPEGERYRRCNIADLVWPNFTVPWTIGTGRILLFWPISPGRCEIEVYGLGPDWGEGPLPPERAQGNAIFDKVMAEDISNLEAIQASLNSGAFTGMMLNYQERRIYWMHEAIDRAIGAARTPPELAVKPVLEPFVQSV